MNFFKAIGRFFQRLFSPGFRDAVDKLGAFAIPFAEAVAAATPNRTDDEILAAYKKYNKEGLWDPKKPTDVLLRDLVVAIVRDFAPGGTPTRLIILAVELAYNAYREKATSAPAA